jgi:hypothetical protein
MHGHESSIEGESFECGEEDDIFEKESMVEFFGWPPELLLTLQHRWGLHHKHGRYVQGESSGRKDKAEQRGERRGRGCLHWGTNRAPTKFTVRSEDEGEGPRLGWEEKGLGWVGGRQGRERGRPRSGRGANG